MLKHLIVLAVVSSVFVDSYKLSIQNDEEEEDDDVMEDQPSSDNDDGNLVTIGDMLLSKEQYDFLYHRDPNKRVGHTDVNKKWPNGIVPIKFNDGDFDKIMKDKVRFAMDYIMNVSCIKFQTEFDRTKFPNYILVKYRDGSCSSQVGNRQNGSQALNLHDKCGKGNIIHELLHSLGFLHMHTAPDRDDYVKIIPQNIRPATIRNFEKTLAPVSMYNTIYDYSSIMHYGRNSFQKGNPDDKLYTTILPKEQASEMGQRRRMTDGDITRLNRMYKCPGFEEKDVELYQEFDLESADEILDPSDLKQQDELATEETSAEILTQRLKSLANGLSRLMKPLCAYEKRLASAFKNV